MSEGNLVSKQQLFKIFSLHTCTYNLANVETLLKFSCSLIFLLWYGILVYVIGLHAVQF